MRDDPIRVRLMSQRGGLDERLFHRRMPGGRLRHGLVEFDLGSDKPADVVLVQNYLKYDQRISARDGYIWKWDNEPIVRNRLVGGYDRIYSHHEYPRARARIPAPPILDWWVDKTYDELVELKPPTKTEWMSAIASTKSYIPGHIQRSQFIDQVEKQFPRVKLFGHGRPIELADKWEGLAPFRYSIAIENTSKEDYWTEKLADCFLSYTVPLYFGATNISEYFPDGSYIWLPIDDPPAALEIIEKTYENDDYASRIPALREARELILNKYSFYAQVTSRIESEIEEIRKSRRIVRRVHGRRIWRRGWIRGLGLRKNALNQSSRLGRHFPVAIFRK